MSSVTSLRVSKGSSKFVPKAKPRATRRAKPTEGQVDEEGTDDSEAISATADTQKTPESRPQQQPPPPPPPLVSPPSVLGSHGIPMVGSSSQQTGIPIVVGESSHTTGIPRVGSRALHAGRRGSTIGSPTSPAMRAPGRLASLNSPLSPSSVLSAAMNSPTSGSRRAGRGGGSNSSQLNSPTSKRQRTADSASEPAINLRLRTADDYRVLNVEEINRLPIGFFCKATRHGKPTQEFIDRENEFVRLLMEPTSSKDAPLSGSGSGNSNEQQKEAPAPEAASNAKMAAGAPRSVNRMAAQMRIVDGKAVLDTESLVINRSDMAEANAEPLEVVDESSRKRFVNSLTYARKRATRKRWTAEETEQFFCQLRAHGSDFEMIAAVMPDRNRYDIKNKFKREERLNPTRITNLLLMRPESAAAAPPLLDTAAAGSVALPASLEAYSMVNTPEPRAADAEDNSETGGDADSDGSGDESSGPSRMVRIAVPE
ncbi:hypothetical protein H4R26_003539 [Coemansia thaxteri]|uniref:Myb-like domain-containing protein n=1 Tax=Coemansia thaxteri TaxID=2663907 RepID=A0A9W8EEI9_9FUNG|nr:hypothetical protein H4R26_003539 [Coemansia thaxteri]KAJ2484112.1 hypothetical protein EV174_002689 [Coemansia sp. RSA 2320]